MSRADENLAVKWGVGTMLVMQLRKQHLREPEDFVATPQVTYTDAGEKKMAGLLHIDLAKKEGGQVDGREEGGESPALHPFSRAGSIWMDDPEGTAPVALGSSHTLPETVGMLVLKVWPNPTFITVRTPEGKEAQVRVRNNGRVVRGLTLRCRQWPDGRVECVHPGLHVPLSALPGVA